MEQYAPRIQQCTELSKCFRTLGNVLEALRESSAHNITPLPSFLIEIHTIVKNRKEKATPPLQDTPNLLINRRKRNSMQIFWLPPLPQLHF